MSLLLSVLLRKKGRSAAAGVMTAAVFMGLVLSSFAANPPRPVTGDYPITGVVEGAVRLREDGQVAMTLEEVSLSGKGVEGKAYWTFYLEEGETAPVLSDGDHVSFQGRLYHPEGQINPHGFDFNLYLLQKGIRIGLYGKDGLAVSPSQTIWDGSITYRLRTALAQNLIKVMGETGNLAALMLLGAGEGLPEEEREAFRETGVAHVLAISGLHVGYLAVMLSWLLSWLPLGPKQRFVVHAVFLTLYCGLIGGTTSAFRAAVMYLMLTGAKAWGRDNDPMTSISAAFLLLLLIRPLDLFSASFQLSFGAVAGIVLFGPSFTRTINCLLPGKRNRLAEKIKGLFPLGLAAQIGVALPLAVFYQEIPLLGLLLNLVVIPYVMVLLIAFLAALLLSPFGIVGIAAGFLADLLAKGLLCVVGWAAGLPGTILRVPSPSFPVALGICLLLVLLSPYVVWRGRRRLALLSLTVVLAAGGAAAVQNRAVRYIQFSVGQADAAILEDGSFTAVIDTGETGEEIASYLRAEGRNVDALILTHLHMDHAGGAAQLLKDGITIRKAYIPYGAEKTLADEDGLAQLALLRQAGVPVETLSAGDELKSGRAAIQAVWPMEGKVRPWQDANAYSLGLRLLMEDAVLLSTADITGAYEKYAEAPADILKVAHHGSGDSTNEDFLNAVDPQMALLSAAGSGGLPSQALLNRLNERKIPIYRTDDAGAVTLLFIPGAWKVYTFR